MVDAMSPQALSELIGSIYDCALDPSHWDQTLPDLMDAFDSHASALTLSDLRHDRLLLFKTAGLEPHQVDQFSKHVPEVEVILREALASLPSLDEPWVASRHLTTKYIETSPYFQEFAKPTGTIDIMEPRMAETLDALRCAVVLTSEHGTILHANRSAEQMLRDGGPIQSVQGILQATAPSAATELRCALALAARNEANIGKTGLAIRLSEPDVAPIFAHVLPLTGSDFRTLLQPAAVAAVFIGAPSDAQEGADIVAAAFGLTPAETRVLASLFAGRTLAGTAATLGIAGATAKTHLEHIFLKTGATHQSELMRLWTGLISPTRSNT